MRKMMLLTALVVMFCKCAALSTGDEALEIKSKFYNGKIFKARFYMVDAKNKNKLKIVVFARLLADDFLQSDPLLANIGKRKGVSLAVVTPSEAEIEPFLKMKPAFEYAVLSDRNANKSYMEQNIIYPRAFVINYENKIIWDGELIDLPDMLDKFEAGKYDLEVNRKINRYLAEMQNALRGGSEYQLDRAARAILALDPGNLACLRMRLFAFENTNQLEEAWKFLEEFRHKYPQEKHLYMLQIDLGARYVQLSNRAAQTADDFVKAKLGDNNDRLLLAWLLLSQYNFDSDALNSSEKLLNTLSEESFKGMPMQQALFNRSWALLYYKKCDISEAVKKQSRACAVSDTQENRKILKYYQSLMKK